MKQSDLAQKIGTGYQSVSNWENGVSAPKLEVVCALADILDVAIDYLVGRTTNPKVNKARKKPEPPEVET